MAELRHRVDRKTALRRAVEIFAGGRPVDVHALRIEQVAVPVVVEEGEGAVTAIAHDLGRDPLGELALAARVQVEADIRVAVRVDEAGRNPLARRVDRLRRRDLAEVAHRDDLVRNERDVRLSLRLAGAIDDGPIDDSDIDVHVPFLLQTR